LKDAPDDYSVLDIILAKRDGYSLTRDQIRDLIEHVAAGSVPSYQLSSFLMAVLCKGMDAEETVELTRAMAESGRILDWRGLGVSVDKHSTGGVGDKLSLIVAPLWAALGLYVPMISGRGLGHTGGTLDKLESIPGLRTGLSLEEFKSTVERCGMAIVAQTSDLAPADGVLYALRDVTGTVESAPLIVSSILSKKIAAGPENLVFDVKFGTGAFMQEKSWAEALARELVRVGSEFGRKCCALLTSMDDPIGVEVGNSLEVKEAIQVLRGEGPADTKEVSVALCAAGLMLAGIESDRDNAIGRVQHALSSGSALEKFAEMISAQGGDSGVIENPGLLPSAPVTREVVADRSGYIASVDSRRIGHLCTELGGGRRQLGDLVDHGVGISIYRKTSQRVDTGDVIGLVHGSTADAADRAVMHLQNCFETSEEVVNPPRLIDQLILADQVAD